LKKKWNNDEFSAKEEIPIIKKKKLKKKQNVDNEQENDYFKDNVLFKDDMDMN